MSFLQSPFRIFGSETILGKLCLFHECHSKTAVAHPEIKCASTVYSCYYFSNDYQKMLNFFTIKIIICCHLESFSAGSTTTF